jgi:hypothetical protein
MSFELVVLADNVFNVDQYPNHTVTASTEAEGFPASRVANGRRVSTDYWTPNVFNTDSHVQSVGNRPIGVNMLALDRGHNLPGEAVELRISSDGFTTYETLSYTVPALSTPGGSVDDPNGVLTREGAWLKRFDLRVGRDFRFFVGQMGAGERPLVVGLWIGLAVPLNVTAPFDAEGEELVAALVESEYGWQARSSAAMRGSGSLELILDTLLLREQASYHLHSLFGHGFPMWIVFDTQAATESVLAVRPDERISFSVDEVGDVPRGTLEYQELAPRLP